MSRVLSQPVARALSPREAGSDARITPRLTSTAVLWIGILVLGCAVRVAYIDRPLDHRLTNAWREADYTQIARNFWRDDLNIFYPRVDWRGDTPGYAEMELPLLPWTAALGYHLFGYNEAIIRAIAAGVSIIGFLVFARLTRDMLPVAGACLATLLYSINPMLVRLATAMQPEPFMMMFSVLCVYHLHQWDKSGRARSLVLAAAMLALATLCKAPAAAIGVVFAFVVLRRCGWAAFRSPLVLVAAFITVGPPIGWYLWAKHFWTQYGLSLGLSNESHWIGRVDLMPPKFLIGNLKWEMLAVFGPIGALLSLFALIRRRSLATLAFVWYASAWVFYIAAAGTSGDDWAWYYHASSIPAACLLIGAGYSAVIRRSETESGEIWSPGRGPLRWRLAGHAMACLAVGWMAASAAIGVYRRDHHDDLWSMRQAATELAASVPVDGLIIVRGGKPCDEFGRPVAYNESMFFAWMDRKGFNYPRGGSVLDSVAAIARRGGRYWIARRDEVKDPAVRREAEIRYRWIAESRDGAYQLFDLGPRG